MPSADSMNWHAEHNSYEDFALVYDEMMNDLDYPAWAAYVVSQAQRCGIDAPGPLLDLACGTGVFLELMAGRGWKVTGVDLSPSMLAVAEERLRGSGIPPRLFCQDLRELKLREEYPLITCLCDSLNYITAPHDLELVLASIRKALAPQGVFITDLNSIYKYQHILGNNTFAATFDHSAYIWLNSFDPEENRCRMELDFFQRRQGELFRHFHEVHTQRAYSIEEFIALAEAAGFSLVEVFGSFSLNADPPRPTEERVFFLCRK